LVRANSRDFVIEVRRQWDADRSWCDNVNAVSFEVAIVAKVDSRVCPFHEVAVLCDWGRERDRCRECGKSERELHIE
jgi:hypothetical protein